MDCVIYKTLWANCAGLGVHVEVRVSRTGHAGFSVPDGLVVGTSGGSKGDGGRSIAGVVIADALQLGGVEGVSRRTADALSGALIPVGELGTALTGLVVSIPVVGSSAGNADRTCIEVRLVSRAKTAS